MTYPFIDRPPSLEEIEKLRLLLSTFQDGSGMLKTTTSITLPGWRDFERACALTFNGEAVENKFFVDVVLPFHTTPASFYGIDCKMRRELRAVERKGIITVEVTNAAKQLWSYLAQQGITEANFVDEAQLAGSALLQSIEQLKESSSSSYPLGNIDTKSSYYFVLLWDLSGEYQLFQLPLALPEPDDLKWTCFVGTRTDGTRTTRLVGETEQGVLYEWYGDSGGQFKYYPRVESALWVSQPFWLEPFPDHIEAGIIAKAKIYFPDQWHAIDR